jgi:hypothetical protein
MPRYALLILPAANRVYADAAPRLTQAELGVFATTVLSGRLHDIEEVEIGGVPYIAFSTETPLIPRDIGYLSQLSSLYALFELTDDCLRPVVIRPLAWFDDDLLTIQKYAGKTNEQFTKLLLNVTVLSSASAERMLEDKLHVLDPVCGRGTTLNQALMYGYDATGIEIDDRHVEAYSAFIRAWLKRKRIKHKAEFTPIRREGKVIGRRLHIILAPTKEAYKAGQTLSLTVVNGDTVRAREYFRANLVDVAVADLPYGVQHGSRAPGGPLSRRPLDLLRAALPGWVEMLRPGGALGISWNTYLASREDMAEALERAGLRVRDDPPYQQFRHRVDQAIIRDVLVATKP